MKEILLDSSFSEEDRNLIHSACLQVQSAIDLHGSNAKSVIPQIINGLVSKSTHKSNEFLVVVGLWVAALSLLKKHLHSEDYKYPTLQAFFNVYITILDFENRSEQEALWHTANWMAMLLSLLPSTQNNKPLAMLVVPKVAEGWQADYVTGPDKSNAAAKRAQIYSVESSVDIENNADMDDTSSTTYPEDMGVLGGIRDDNNNKTTTTPPYQLPPVEVPRAMRFFEVVGKLKTLKRTGWVHNGIPLPESVSDHMYRMSMLCFMITDSRVNKDRLMKICMVHDLAESIVGDITPHCGVSKEEKRRLEEQALRSIVTDINYPEISNEILSLWLAYEEQNSYEAQIAHQLDKLEMIIQANEYEKAHAGQVLTSFFTSTADDFHHPEVLAWAEAVREERRARLACKM